MNPTIQNAAITNWITDADGMYFYTLAKYWTKHHNQEDWEIENDLEVFLECRSYVGPSRTRSEYKIKLTIAQYAYLLCVVENSGPEVAHNYIERNRAAWATPSLSTT